MMLLTALITVVAAYLIGSISFAIIFTKIFAKKDVRTVGSGNAGTTNTFRAAGKKVGILTFICDFLKGTLSAYLGKIIFEYIFNSTGDPMYSPIYGAYICGLACMIGHIFPLFFEFRGGKGVATGAGIFLAFCPIATAIGLLLFAISLLITKTVSVSSLVGTVSVVICALIMYDKSSLFLPQMIMAVIIGLIIIIKHKDNIVRIINGEERKISIGGKK